eukprot:TRINITY_DN19777_c0_g1_i1.p1 TRINITY_DN19777_c0_g1~~TRINITY_DN19777_c0_g1_i1.p1  ORF type:complete len:427 (+),score=61.89 TRINITY_DN19777_c0_g1_i1:210-1490(+)
MLPLSAATHPDVETSDDCTQTPTSAVLECCVLARLIQRWSSGTSDEGQHEVLGTRIQHLQAFYADTLTRTVLVQSEQGRIQGEGQAVDCMLLDRESRPRIYLRRTRVSALQMATEFASLLDQEKAHVLLPFLVMALHRLHHAAKAPASADDIDRLVSEIASQHGCAQVDEPPWILYEAGTPTPATQPLALLPQPMPDASSRRPSAVQSSLDQTMDPALETAIQRNRELHARERPDTSRNSKVQRSLGMQGRLGEHTSDTAAPAGHPWRSSEAVGLPSALGTDVWGAPHLETVVDRTELPELQSGAHEENLKAIGRWGEQLVFQLLARSADTVSVEWLNEVHEAGHPYDLIVIRESGAFFVEVKSTTSLSQCTFPITASELRHSEEHGRAYEVFRVFGAGSTQAWVRRVPHLWSSNFTLLCSLGEEQ